MLLLIRLYATYSIIIGHPTCMDLGTIGDVLRSYDWKCVECKTCEVCSEKGDDVRDFSYSL